ncbi:SUMF1/EgtB/PvdO family nonheme iron enzyme [Candidatus Fermentibacteria bacterium]|nr:SUMF1/EgtB/PvdO family nonheme iron enzyme [Candidatus Fermentibacteria bacterium]
MKRARVAPTVPVGPGRLPRVGEVVGTRYRIAAHVGKGGYGDVFKAHDLRLDLPVALKFLRGSIAQDQAAWEARFGRAVVHPVIARIHDLAWEHGMPYLVMELVEGPTLSADLAIHGPCSVFQALYLLETICPALEAASDKGMLHGDLKLANIMVRPDGTLALVDFGTALLLAREDIPAAGTPDYMAPEVLAGGPLTASSEIYSLGICLYELLTASLPRDTAPTGKRSSKRPSIRLSNVRPDADPRVCDLVATMIQPDVSLRPKTLREVHDMAQTAMRQIRIEGARSLLADLWSKRVAVIAHDAGRNPDLYRVLLAQRPHVLIPADDQASWDFVSRAHPSGPHAPEHTTAYATVAELERAFQQSGAHKIVVVGVSPSPGPATTALLLIVPERDAAWTTLRNPSPTACAVPLTLQDLGSASEAMESMPELAPEPAPGGGPYTRRSRRAYRSLSKVTGALIRVVLEHPVTLVDGLDVSGRTSLALCALLPVLANLGKRTVYVPRLLPSSRIIDALSTDSSDDGAIVVVDDHRQWPFPPTWPWDHESWAGVAPALSASGGRRLVLIAHTAHAMEAETAARHAGIEAARLTLPQNDHDRMLDLFQRAGASDETASRLATRLGEDGWLPFELQLALRWARTGEGLEGWSLEAARKMHVHEALGAVSLGWQEPARRVIAALATGRGRTSLDEAATIAGLSMEEMRGLGRKLVAVKLLRGVWHGKDPWLEIPRGFATPLLEMFGPEFIEARALRQSLELEISLAKSFETRIEGPRLALLRQLSDSCMLDERERAFLETATEHLREEERTVRMAVEAYALCCQRLADARAALGDLPATVSLSTENGYARARGLAAGLAAEEARQQESFDEATLGCHRLLVKDPSNAEARGSLTDLHWRAMAQAEEQARWNAARHHRDLALLYGGKHFRQRLEKGASVLIDSSPRASVSLYRLIDRDGILVDEGEGVTAATPCMLEGLESGPWRAVVEGPGHVAAAVAFNLRCGHEERIVAHLYRHAWLGDDMVHVPAGVFRFGGDPKAPGGGFERDVMVGDFFLARFPITFRQYCQFLDAQALPLDDCLIPRGEQGQELVMRTSDGRHLPVPARLRVDGTIRYRGSFELEIPVVGVSWEAACRYCRWLSAEEHRSYRLPSEVEWEKAARSGQGRAFPWGDGFSPARCKMRDSRPGPPGLEPVGVFTADLSVCGIRDLAGGVAEWCSDLEAGLLGLRVIRGGSWIAGADGCRAAARGALPEEWQGQWVGFRVCFGADDEP